MHFRFSHSYLRNFPFSSARPKLSGELERLLIMYEMEAQFGMFPGKPVPRVKASDIKAVWKLGQEAKARSSGTGAVGIGDGYVKLVCSPGANITAVSWRGMRLGILMTRLGKQDAWPPDFLFSIYARLPLKWWAFGESHRMLCFRSPRVPLSSGPGDTK